MQKEDDKTKLKIKRAAEQKRCIKECEINIGDSVLVKKRRENKFTLPFNPTPMLVINKNNSLITAQSDTKTVTRNSFHFKKLTMSEKEVEKINENT